MTQVNIERALVKGPLDTDGHVVFCQQEYHPAYEVLSYRKLSGASRQEELSCRAKSHGL